MRNRCWNLRLNIDAFNSAYARLDSDAEMADFLKGFFKGVNDAHLRDDASDAMASGYGLGDEMRLEGEDYMARSVENGKRGREAKSNRIEPPSSHPGTPPPATLEPGSTQSTIHNPQSTNQHPKEHAASAKPRKTAKKSENMIPAELAEKIETITTDWPKKSVYDEKEVRVTRLVRPQDLWDRLVKFVPEPDRVLALNCGLVYLDELDSRPKHYTGLVPNVCAMTNFYGEKELWKRMVDKVQEVSRG